MIKILNQHTKYREEKNEILISQCKLRQDFRLNKKFLELLNRLKKGLEENKLNESEKKFMKDLGKAKMMGNLTFKQITKETIGESLILIDKVLGKERSRKSNEIKLIFEKEPKFFIGAFLDNTLVGIITGFYRDKYLVLGEIAVIDYFQNRGIGNRLVKEFLKLQDKEIRVGSEDDAIKFYESINFKPFLLIQYDKKDYNKRDFSEFEEFEYVENKGHCMLSVKIGASSKEKIELLRKKFPKAYLQYIFRKPLSK